MARLQIKLAAFAAVVLCGLGAGFAGLALTPSTLDQARNSVVRLDLGEDEQEVVQERPNPGRIHGPVELTRHSCSAVSVGQHRFLTAAHCVDEDKTGYVNWNGHRAHYKTLWAGQQDDGRDLALIVMDAEVFDVPAVKIALSWEIDQPVYAIGFPAPLKFQTTTPGVIVSEYVTVPKNMQNDNDGRMGPYIQSNTKISPGNSGGALFNARGQLVGITVMITMIPKGMMALEGMALSVPSKTICLMGLCG